LVLVLIGATGCGKSLETPDGGGDPGAPNDPAACGCVVDGYALTMSWDCFCKQYDCTGSNVPKGCGFGTYSQITTGCGLQELSIETIGGPERWVYDSSGNLVGEQLGTDAGQFSCPTAPNLVGFSVRAGQFPDGCLSAVTCQCNADAGTCDATDAGLSGYPI
jgi:hypothetical protein